MCGAVGSCTLKLNNVTVVRAADVAAQLGGNLFFLLASSADRIISIPYLTNLVVCRDRNKWPCSASCSFRMEGRNSGCTGGHDSYNSRDHVLCLLCQAQESSEGIHFALQRDRDAQLMIAFTADSHVSRMNDFSASSF